MVTRGTLGVPGASRKPPGSLLGAGRDGFWIATKIDEGFEAFRACPGGHFGSRPGPKNRLKIDLWRKRWPWRKCREAFFIDFRCHRCFGSVFASIFDGFLMFFCMFFWLFLLAIFVSFFIPNLFRISHFVYDFLKAVMLLKLQFLHHKTLFFKVRRVEDFDHKLQRKCLKTHNET